MSERCPLCPGKNKCVRNSGPTNSPYVFIGEAPGSQEEKDDMPFCGKTGNEVNRHYLPIANLKRENVRFTNAIRCLPPGPKGKLDSKKQKDLDLLASCAQHHLYPELERNNYSLIVPMGAFAVRAINPDINLEVEHGFPMPSPFGQCFPMYHPAGGIHEPKKMLIIRTDWTRFRRYLVGKLPIPYDPFANSVDYRWLETPQDVHDVLMGQWDNDLATDTEVTHFGQPYCLTFSTEPGTGYLIKADQEDVLDCFQSYLNRWSGRFIFHNWMFDGPIVARMGLRYRFKQVKDTMVRVFNMANQPQGLKALSWRLFGMKMQDFDDVVTPHSKEVVLNYYRNMFVEDWPTPEAQMLRQDDGSYKQYKPQGMNTKLKRFWTDYAKNSDKDVFDMWGNWEDHHEAIEELCGPWPGKCISHAPFESIIWYACRDADATIRLWRWIKKARPFTRKLPQEAWEFCGA